MKKFLSLLLAAMLCLCALTPAMAENLTVTTEKPFTFTLDSYKAMYNMVAQSVLQVTPVWTTDEATGNVIVTTEGFSDVTVTVDENNNVTGVNTLLKATDADLQDKANAYGMIVAVAGMSAAMLENPELGVNFADEFTPLFTSLLNSIVQAIQGETVKVVGDVAGTTCACTMSIDLTSMEYTFGFHMAPLGTVIE